MVEGQRVAGDKLPEIPPSGALLTLVTSAGSGWLGQLAPSHLVYVDAELQGKLVATPRDRPVAVPTAEIQGHSDPARGPRRVLVAGTAGGSHRRGVVVVTLGATKVLAGRSAYPVRDPVWPQNEAMRLLPELSTEPKIGA